MAERRRGRRANEPAVRDEEFVPSATMGLMLMYVVTFAALWGLVYYLELLARR